MAKWTQAKKFESPKGKILLAVTKSKNYFNYHRRELILNIIIFLLIFILYLRS